MIQGKGLLPEMGRGAADEGVGWVSQDGAAPRPAGHEMLRAGWMLAQQPGAQRLPGDLCSPRTANRLDLHHLLQVSNAVVEQVRHISVDLRHLRNRPTYQGGTGAMSIEIVLLPD